MTPRKAYLWIVAGLVIWGIVHAIGAYRFNHNVWRGVIVLGASAAFLGFWALLAANRERRLRLAAAERDAPKNNAMTDRSVPPELAVPMLKTEDGELYYSSDSPRPVPSAPCCESMVDYLQHGETALIYLPKFREFGLLVLDGGRSSITIRHCPWCGCELPSSLRDEWFGRLEQMGLEAEDAPHEMRSEKWWIEKERLSAKQQRPEVPN